jgi:hypothetical protein
MEEQNKEAPVPKKKVSRRMLIVLGVCILIWLPFLFSSSGSSTTQPKEEDYSTTAYLQSQGYVKNALKSPASAKFPYSYEIRNLPDNRFVVSSYVDSQNSFGAMLRSNWVVTLQYLGGNEFEGKSWKLEAMTVDGERVYP